MWKPKKEDKAGLYLTVIVHLVVIITLLSCRITRLTVKENTFVLDFSNQEEAEELRRREEFKADISAQLDEMIANASAPQSRTNIRNIAVDANDTRTGEQLRDDRGANDVYDQARELQRKLDASRNAALEEQFEENAVDLSGKDGKKKKNKEKTVYKGPSVVSYSLDGRKAVALEVPAYKCIGGGDVSVVITVNRSGRVTDAEVIQEVSEPDECLWKYAVQAAKRSIFKASESAPTKQTGEIVYRFVAQ